MIYRENANSSRNQQSLREMIECLGHTNVHVWWEPAGGDAEIGTDFGGFLFDSDQNGVTPLGASYEEAEEYIHDGPWFDLRGGQNFGAPVSWLGGGIYAG